MEKTLVYLGLGGNEGDVLLRLRRAFTLLSHENNVEGLQASHFYQTTPVQVESPLWFVNCVFSFYTTLEPRDIFEMTQKIETQLGKIPKPKTAARPIDIDLLFYGHQRYQDQQLEIPHPSWKTRLFVLIPLSDLTQDMILQGIGGLEHYVLQDLIQLLWNQHSQAVSLLEKNPDLR